MGDEDKRLVRPEQLWKWLLSITLVGASFVLMLLGVFTEATLSKEVWIYLQGPVSQSRRAFAITAILTAVGFLALWIWSYQIVIERESAVRLRAIDLLQRKHRDQVGELEKRLGEFEQQLHTTQLERDTNRALLLDSERRRLTDVVTGVPNYAGWEKDLGEWASRSSEERPFSMALIDLNNFKQLNNRSPRCADQVLRFFAQRTHAAMRRDEQVYKGPDSAGAVLGGKLWAEMYRCYAGGDEFFFIFSGGLEDALGFLNRLEDRLDSYSDEIRKSIFSRFVPGIIEQDMADNFRLSFAGVVTSVRANDTPASVLENLLNALARAKSHSEARVLLISDEGYQTPAECLSQIDLEVARFRRMPSQTQELQRKVASLQTRATVVRGAVQRFSV